MATIAKPRALLLYLVDKLEQQGTKPISDTLVDICTVLQKAGSHIYSLSGDPQDPYLREDIASDLQYCQQVRWIITEQGCLSMTEQGRMYITGMTPPAEIEAKLEVLLPLYRPQ